MIGGKEVRSLVGVVALRRGGAGVDFLAVPDAWDKDIDEFQSSRHNRAYISRGRRKI